MASHAQLLVLVGGDSEIPISLDPLPPFEDEVMYLLEEELPPAHYWTQIASHLLRHRRAADAHALLTRGLAAMQRRPAEQQHLHAMLAATHLAAAPAAPKTKLHDARFQLLPPELQTKDVHLKAAAAALELAARANGGDAKAPLQVGALLSRALLAASAGRNDEADRLFEQVLALKGRAEHPVALLGKACCLLRRRAYAPALRLYQQVLSLALAQDARAKQAATEEEAQGDDGAPSSQLKWLPWVGPDPRVGMGLALWGLNRPADARRAWARAAALDPSAAAPALLLGLAALHSAKALEAPLGRDEEAARAALYAEGIANIQRAWASDKNIAMTACALADHIITRASAEAPTRGAAWAKGEFARALKLGEHALQRADSRSAATQAQLLFARAAHLAFALEDPLGSDRVGDVDALELRSSAQRYYGMAIESLSRSAPGEGASSELPAGLALATLSLAQMQVARGESLGAIVALDELLARPGASAKASATLEPALLLACLRAISHPGATALEREADRERARPLLERTLRSIDAARTAVRGARGRDEYDADGETHEEVKEEAATVLARSALAGERLSRKSLEAIAALGDEPLAHVQLAELWQSGTRPNLARAATAYAAALRAATSRTSTTTGGDDAELLVRLRNNIGALHGLRGAEVGDAAQRESILGAAASHLQAALGAARQAEAQLSVPKATFLDAEKTTTLYNLGRILESAGSTAEARQAYEAVLQAHAEYVDAKVRLALLTASVRGGDKEATRAADALLKEALASDPSHFDTRMTYVCFLAGELPASPSPPPWEGIKELIGQLFVGPDGQGPSLFGGAAAAHAIRDQARLDSYTLAALGWTYYHLAHQTKPGPEHRKLRAKAFSRAIELLDRALSADSACAFAAQALAILAAEGVLHELANSAEGEQRRKAGADAALSLLTRVKDVREDGSVQICMGHALMLREDFDASFKMVSVQLPRGIRAPC
jgi:RNA polymerase-associated protein CTR9